MDHQIASLKSCDWNSLRKFGVHMNLMKQIWKWNKLYSSCPWKYLFQVPTKVLCSRLKNAFKKLKSGHKTEKSKVCFIFNFVFSILSLKISNKFPKISKNPVIFLSLKIIFRFSTVYYVSFYITVGHRIRNFRIFTVYEMRNIKNDCIFLDLLTYYPKVKLLIKKK